MRCNQGIAKWILPFTLVSAALTLVRPITGAEPEKLTLEEVRALLPERLHFKREVVADADNGYELLRQACNVVQQCPKGLAFTHVLSTSPHPEGDAGRLIDEYLASNEEALALLRRALHKPRIYFPGELSKEDRSAFARVSQLAVLKVRLAHRHCVRNEFEDAARELNECYDLGCKLARSGVGDVIYFNICRFASERAIEAWQATLSINAWPEELLSKAINDLSAKPGLAAAFSQELAAMTENHARYTIPKSREDLVQTVGKVALVLDNDLQEFARDEEFLRIAWDLGQYDQKVTVKFAGEFLSSILENATLPYTQRKRVDELVLAESAKLRTALTDMHAIYSRLIQDRKPVDHSQFPDDLLERSRNLMGRSAVLVYARVVNEAWYFALRSDVSVEALRIAFAIHLYRSKQGRAPETLEELVKAGYLQSVPQDFFSGRPLQYDPKRQILWSVGRDEVDNNGKKFEDVVIKLPELR